MKRMEGGVQWPTIPFLPLEIAIVEGLVSLVVIGVLVLRRVWKPLGSMDFTT
jgi:hydrogenase-4 membrane subunit HyfE